MPNIGQAALTMTANSEKLQQGMDKAAKDTQSWMSRMGSGLVGILESTKVRTAALWTGIVAAGLAALGKANERIKELTDEGRKAARLGIDPTLFMGLTQQAERLGVDVDAVNVGLTKLGAHLAAPEKAFVGSLRDLGLSLADLQKQDTGHALLDISTAIKQLPSPAQQAAAAMGIFGKQGVAMLPILQKGGDAIREFVQEQKEMGLALTAPQMAALESARAVIPRFSALWTGLMNQLLVAFSPLIELINGALSDAIKSVKDNMSEIVEVVLSIAWAGTMGFAALEDGLNAIGGAFAYVGGLAVQFFSLLVQGFKETLYLMSKLPDQFGGSLFKVLGNEAGDFEKRMDALAAKIKENAAKNFQKNNQAEWQQWWEDWAKRKQKLAQAMPIGQLNKAADIVNNPAAEKGSREAASIEAKYTIQSRLQKQDKQIDLMQRQVGLAERLNGTVEAIKGIIGVKPDIGVV